MSQEVLRPEDYKLAAEISQFSAFQDDWALDHADELQDLDQDDGLFVSDLDTEEKDSTDDSDCDLELESDDDSNADSDSDEVCFALPPLTDYPRSFSKNEVLEKLNLFTKDHGFTLVIKTSNPKQRI